MTCADRSAHVPPAGRARHPDPGQGHPPRTPDPARTPDPSRTPNPSRTTGPSRRRLRRTPYLWWGLLLVPALIAGDLYLASGPGGRAHASGSAPSGSGTAAASSTGAVAATASPAVASAAGTAPGLAACGPACAVTPFHASLARVPAHAHRSSARRAASPSASASHTAPRASGSAAASPSVSAPPASQQGTPADQVLALINQARASAGLPPLTVTSGLEASASAHNLRMADGCGLTHQCPGEPAIGARETAAGVSWTAAGENIGEGGPMPDTAAAMAQTTATG